ncbi:MAG TPA: polysaccharide biosynthesis tyrosine autokinase [Thermomicrobiales bacterium]|nr:polysaccharide biosynthesis tyrosine autokinase [Thermomicrobiales bacterium]
MDVDLRQLFHSALRYWWLVIALPIALGVMAFLYTARQDPMYRAEVSLEVRASSTNDNAYDILLGSERQAKTYQRLVKDPAVLQAAAQHIQPPMDIQALTLKVGSRVDSGTSLLIISVADTNPESAATIANLIAQELVKVVDARNEESVRQRTTDLQQRIADLKTEIDTKRAEILELERGPDADTDAVVNRIADLNVDIGRDQDNIQLFQTQIGTVIANPGDTVRIFSTAVPPREPFAPRKLMNIVLGIMLGLMLAAGAILLIDYLDNTVKATLDFPQIVGGPLLATVRAIDRIKPGHSQLFVLDDPKGVPAESIRLLRANIEFASATRELVSISLTSPNPGEGKSTISANLAVALAQAGFVTMLIDADLRRPTQHRIFGVANDRGLSSLLAQQDREWRWAACETMLPNLSVITSGPLPPNPADLLSLDRLRQILEELREAVDVIIIDSPPMLAVSDPLIIAAHVDGTALVSLGGKTRLEALKRAVQILHRGAPRIIGVVLNQQSDKSDGGYYYQEYSAVSDEPRGGFRKRRATTSTAIPATTATISPVEQTSAD